MKKLLFAIGVVSFLMASCTSTKSLYSWYDYEDATYNYNKRQTDELKLKMTEQYLKMIEK